MPSGGTWVFSAARLGIWARDSAYLLGLYSHTGWGNRLAQLVHGWPWEHWGYGVSFVLHRRLLGSAGHGAGVMDASWGWHRTVPTAGRALLPMAMARLEGGPPSAFSSCTHCSWL